MSVQSPRARASGAAMLEVLIAIIIVAVGLLGLAQVQVRMHVAEMEAYQRTQATILLRDMTERISANRREAMSYVTSAAAGAGNPVQSCSGAAGVARDLCEWSNALLGAGERLDAREVGAMIDARGCIVNTSPAMPREFVVAVVWRGMSTTAAPSSTDCGAGLYGDERTRRALVSMITIGCLQNNPDTGACLTP
jgi:type IV pilus assembly protein PilV